jgi:NAD/NADP transhydrogenase alpha subunit
MKPKSITWKEGAIVVGVLNPYENKPLFEKYNAKKITSFLDGAVAANLPARRVWMCFHRRRILLGYRAVI